MLRNKEFLRFIIIVSLISIAGIIIGYFISPQAALIIAISCSLIIFVTILFTIWRYREIKRLSKFLRQISNGDYTLDVRDNYEGELSILKSEIFKVTNMLSEQAELLQADKLHLTNAISDISHQLKTPLTSMTMMADLLNKDTLPPEKRAEFTRTIRLQLERIEWLVSALLKLSKIDAGKVQFKTETILVTDLIEKALGPLRIPIEIKALKVNIDGDPSTTVTTDMNWTAEALINLLRNAISHTPEAGELGITFSQNILFTEIIIQDTGNGIFKKDLPYIFKRFYRGENASDDSVGIGLPMAYSIVKEQNGDIEVTSSAETGTAFKVKFYK